jgi:O-6-methylguanine DNA methyltransferase
MRHSAEDRTLRDLLSPTVAPVNLQGRILERLRERRSPSADMPAFDIAASASGISALRLGTGVIDAGSARARTIAERARQELAEYLGGERSYFTIPVDIGSLAPFQREVLDTARRIPFGEVRSYRWIAGCIGNPNAVRAVGTALGRNPVPILVPCHRVLRHDGTLGGYALGLDWKTRFLELEHDTFALVGSTTTKIVCRHGCAHERRIAEPNRVAFASVREAKDSGYRPCRVCAPSDAAF